MAGRTRDSSLATRLRGRSIRKGCLHLCIDGAARATTPQRPAVLGHELAKKANSHLRLDEGADIECLDRPGDHAKDAEKALLHDAKRHHRSESVGRRPQAPAPSAVLHIH